MEVERWLKPRFRLVLTIAGIVVAALWLHLLAFTAYAAVWWPDHHILDNSLAKWIRGMMALSSVLVSPFAVVWVWVRRIAWRVGPEGIAVYRGGRLRRSHAWTEVGSLVFAPHYAVVRSPRRPLGDEIFYLPAADVRWLREIAASYLGPGIIA